jgi:hypothetical protein
MFGAGERALAIANFSQRRVNLLQPQDRDPKIATMEGEDSQDQSDAIGCIPLNALRLKLRVAKGRGGSLQQLKIDPVWDPIRSDPGSNNSSPGKEQIGPNK